MTTQEEINKIIILHNKWLNNEEGGVRANLRSADLNGADLSGADLSGADLKNANLSGTNLRGADLRCADLAGAELSGANLRYATLAYADLRDAKLAYANLQFCIGNNREVKSLQIGKYLISYTKDILNIGCKSYRLEQWKNFTDEEIYNMDKDALDWWNLNKHIIIELAEREKRQKEN